MMDKNPMKPADRPAHDSIERHPPKGDSKAATQVANQAAKKGQGRMKHEEDPRGPFSK
jgi:hypothetical protein